MMLYIFLVLLSPFFTPLVAEDFIYYDAFIAPKVGWNGAIRACGDRGGKLTTIGSQYIQDKVCELLASRGHTDEEFWFDGKASPVDGVWKFKSGSSFEHTNWKGEEPAVAGINGEQKCAVISSDGEYRWQTRNCAEQKGYVCTFRNDNKLTVPCEINWIQYGDSCYSLHLGGASWADARETCTESEADLVEIDTSVESRLPSVLDKKFGSSIDGFWIGLSKADETYTWVNGSPVKWSYWMPGKPSVTDAEDCIVWMVNSDNTGWSNEPCDSVRPFVCEKAYIKVQQNQGMHGDRWQSSSEEEDMHI